MEEQLPAAGELLLDLCTLGGFALLGLLAWVIVSDWWQRIDQWRWKRRRARWARERENQ